MSSIDLHVSSVYDCKTFQKSLFFQSHFETKNILNRDFGSQSILGAIL